MTNNKQIVILHDVMNKNTENKWVPRFSNSKSQTANSIVTSLVRSNCSLSSWLSWVSSLGNFTSADFTHQLIRHHTTSIKVGPQACSWDKMEGKNNTVRDSNNGPWGICSIRPYLCSSNYVCSLTSWLWMYISQMYDLIAEQCIQ